MGKTFRHLTKEDTRMANKQTKTCLVIREMQIITVRRYHYASTIWAKIKRQNQILAITNASEAAEKWNFYTLLLGLQNGTATLKTRWQYLVKLNILLPYNLAISHLSVYPSEMKTYGYVCNCQNSVPQLGQINKLRYVCSRKGTAHNEKQWILIQATRMSCSPMLSDPISMK